MKKKKEEEEEEKKKKDYLVMVAPFRTLDSEVVEEEVNEFNESDDASSQNKPH